MNDQITLPLHDEQLNRIERMLRLLMERAGIVWVEETGSKGKNNRINDYRNAIQRVMKPGRPLHFLTILQDVVEKNLLSSPTTEGAMLQACKKLVSEGILENPQRGLFVLKGEAENDAS